MTVHALISVHDLKRKRGGGGGLSDGNVVCVRRDLSVNSPAEFGPPAGKAWQSVMSLAGEGDADPGFVANFDGSDVTTEDSLVLADGTEIVVGGVTTTALTIRAANDFMENGVILTYPMKMRMVISVGTPTERVLFGAAFVEFDLPKDIGES